MDREVLNRIILARHLYELGANACKSSNDNFLFAATNLLQDSIEAFLLALADHVNAEIGLNTKFDQYIDQINKKIHPKELPFRSKLIKTNKLRVNSKHYGIMPARDEVSRLFVAIREFFEETSSAIFEVKFTTVSVLDLLNDGEVKNLLLTAKECLENKDYAECSINCRKAIYLELLKDFDISKFRDGEPKNTLAGLLGAYSRAPFYTKNQKYIDENVSAPTDYIVIDHGALDQDLLKLSIDSTSFWNVWRLTPEVWRDKDDNWFVKREFDKLEEKHLIEKIEYIYTTTVDIIYSVSVKRANIKSKDYQQYIVNLADKDISVYEKADRKSKIVGVLPKGTLKVDCDYSIEGFHRDGTYWKITRTGKEGYLSGFVSDESLVWEE